MDQISEFLPPQINTFECGNCGTHIEVSSIPHVPCYPCQSCGQVAWRIYAINDTIIYPERLPNADLDSESGMQTPSGEWV